MFRLLLAALFLIMPTTGLRADDAPVPEEQPAQPALPASVAAAEALYQGLLDYLKVTPKPDVAEVNKRADAIKADVDAIQADAAIAEPF
jgi:hypothetical protein